ncbi:MAG: hypothetical protein MUP76_04585 [Acidimicrobiia bacterium]|nr:hypothetical protein [Acidimicrobiia bacterium]
MKKPCAKCPFRAKFKGDGDYLRPGRRAEIALSVLEGAEFPCHETVNYDTEDGEPDERDAEPCIGLDIVMLRAGQSGQMMRIRERLGMLNSDALLVKSARMQMWTWDEVTLDDLEGIEGETCSVVGVDCLAPAGYAVGGGVMRGTEFLDADEYCPECGEPVCANCMEDVEHACFEYRQRANVYPPRRGAPSVPYQQPSLYDMGYLREHGIPAEPMAPKMKATRRDA